MSRYLLSKVHMRCIQRFLLNKHSKYNTPNKKFVKMDTTDGITCLYAHSLTYFTYLSGTFSISIHPISIYGLCGSFWLDLLLNDLPYDLAFSTDRSVTYWFYELPISSCPLQFHECFRQFLEWQLFTHKVSCEFPFFNGALNDLRTSLAFIL